MSRARMSRANTFSPVTFDVPSMRYFRTPSFHCGRVSNCSSNNAAKALLPNGARYTAMPPTRLACNICRRDGRKRFMRMAPVRWRNPRYQTDGKTRNFSDERLNLVAFVPAAPLPSFELACAPAFSAARHAAYSGDGRLSLQREQVEIRLRLLEHPRKGWARHEAVEIGREIFVGLGKRNDGVRVEQCRRRRAVGQGEVVADRPGSRVHLLFHHAVGLAELRRCKVHAVRVGLALGTEPVTHDLLHGFLNVVGVEAGPHPRLPR